MYYIYRCIYVLHLSTVMAPKYIRTYTYTICVYIFKADYIQQYNREEFFFFFNKTCTNLYTVKCLNLAPVFYILILYLYFYTYVNIEFIYKNFGTLPPTFS